MISFFGNQLLGSPVVGVADVHVFDEAHGEAVLPRELDQIDDVVVVDAPLDRRR